MKQNDDHEDEGRENVLWHLSLVSRQSYGNFVFKYWTSGCSKAHTQTSPVLVWVRH